MTGQSPAGVRQAEAELTKEHQKAEALVRDLETARSEVADPKRRLRDAERRGVRETLAASDYNSSDDVSRTGSLPGTPAVSTRDQDVISKAEALLGRGDVAGARQMFEYGLRGGGSALLAFRLAETYDPTYLRKWSVYVRPDPRKARELYDEAAAGGVQVARERITNLPK